MSSVDLQDQPIVGRISIFYMFFVQIIWRKLLSVDLDCINDQVEYIALPLVDNLLFSLFFFHSFCFLCFFLKTFHTHNTHIAIVVHITNFSIYL